MNTYLKEKLPVRDIEQERIDKEQKFLADRQKLMAAPVKADNYSSPLDQDVMKVKTGATNDLSEPVTRIGGQTQKIDTQSANKLTSGEDFARRQAIRNAADSAGDSLNYNDLRKQMADKARTLGRAAKPVGKKLLGAVPVVGGLMQALASEDASAAVPLLGDAEAVGPAAGSLDERIEKGTLTDEDKALLRQQALARMNQQ